MTGVRTKHIDLQVTFMYLDLLEKHVKQGIVHLYLPGNRYFRFGHAGREAHWHVHDEKAMHRIARDWEFELGETYMNGDWEVKTGQLRDLLSILRVNFAEYRINPWLQPLVRLLQQWNKVSRSYANVSHHYDLDEGFFRLFLDRDMHYSCAYFTDTDVPLDQAQQDKCHHIAGKLLLKPGLRVLDIGCGWGSFAFYLAQHHDVEVTGITLSQEQLKVARRRARERGLRNVNFELCDYREHQGRYDRIVSIGMFEHVGQPNYLTYFRKIREMLHAEGVALIHSIGRSGPPSITNPWIRKRIFPGGSLPSLSQVTRGIEDVHLLLADVEVLRLHYAQTLNAWHQNLRKNKDLICRRLGERFYRMWEFYLVSSEISFQFAGSVVFQLQLARQHGVVPITRDYLYRSASIADPVKKRLKLAR